VFQLHLALLCLSTYTPLPPQSRLEELSHLWQELLSTSVGKRQKLQDAQKREHFLREADEVAAWISDREAVVSSEELGKDLEHVEMLQKNFADFLKVRDTHFRLEVN